MVTRNLITWRRAGVLIAVTPTLVWWLERLAALPGSGWFTPDGAFPIGGDFRTFYAAANLVIEGNGGLIYDGPVFRDALAGEIGSYGSFVNPPPFVLVTAPFGWLSFETAWLVLAGLSVAAIAAGLWLLGAKRPLLGVGAALLFPPVYFAITFGQVSALWFLVLAATYYFLRNERQIAAGMAAGLLVMKPSLAVGLAIWWLIDSRRYRAALAAAVASAATYLAISYVVLPEVWSGFLGSFTSVLTGPDFPVRQWAQYSAWSAWQLLFPSNSALALAAGAASVLFVLALLVPVLRRASDLEPIFATVIVLTVLVAPHLISYDWTLLIIAGALIWQTSDTARDLLIPGAIVVSVVSAWSAIVVNTMLERVDYAIQIAPVMLMVVIWVQRDGLFGLSAGLEPGRRV